jgi:hypothetical protein
MKPTTNAALAATLPRTASSSSRLLGGKMRLKNCYIVAFFLPIIFPALIFVLAGAKGWEGIFEGIFTGSLILSFIPYGIFLVRLLWLCRTRSAEKIRKAIWSLPIKFIPYLAIGLFIEFLFYPNKLLPSSILEVFLDIVIFAAITSPIFGYFYILMCFSLIWLLKQTKLIKG